jgi:NAD(P)-dependent dehydrogenase (short-subunit alcohol dehydrogenase family)
MARRIAGSEHLVDGTSWTTEKDVAAIIGGALDTLTIGLAREVAEEGIRVNAVHAGAASYTTGGFAEVTGESNGATMIDLYNASTNQLIGSITEVDLKVLVDGLEEESSKDQDYYITQATIDVLADGRATTHLVALLRSALGSSESVDIRWERR